jgi:hypothetical protein
MYSLWDINLVSVYMLSVDRVSKNFLCSFGRRVLHCGWKFHMWKSSGGMRDVCHMFMFVTCNSYCNSKYCTFVRSDVTVTCILLPTGAWRPFAYLVGWDDSFCIYGHRGRAIWHRAIYFFGGLWNLVFIPTSHKQFLSSRRRFDVSLAKLSRNYVEMSSRVSSKEQECASRVVGDICRILCSTINRNVYTLYWNKNISTFWINGAFYYKTSGSTRHCPGWPMPKPDNVFFLDNERDWIICGNVSL